MTPWRLHAGIIGTLALLGVLAAFVLGSTHPHAMFSPAFFLVGVAIFGTAHAAVTTPIVLKWGTTVRRVLLIHLATLIGVPALFGLVASTVA